MGSLSKIWCRLDLHREFQLSGNRVFVKRKRDKGWAVRYSVGLVKNTTSRQDLEGSQKQDLYLHACCKILSVEDSD